MKNLLVITAISLGLTTTAQVTITASDMPNAGDSILVSMAPDIGPNDLETTDSNFVWDYSMLVPNLQRYEKFDNPLGFSLPFNLIFNPFNCTYGNDNNLVTTSSIPGMTFDEAYDFMRESSSKFRQVGVGYRINGIPMPFLYSTDDVIYRFPLNFADTDTGDYAYGLAIPSLGYYGQTGHRETIADGWGTLTTPFGTFNTLRVKSTIAAVDTMYFDTLGFGFSFPRPLRYEYKWIANGKKIPVLQVDADDVLGLPVISAVTYIDSVIPGVPQLSVAERTNDLNTSLYPNPAVSNSTFQYSLSAPSTISIYLADLTGRKIILLPTERQKAGTHKQQINTSSMEAGVYLVVLETSSGRAIQRLVVTR